MDDGGNSVSMRCVSGYDCARARTMIVEEALKAHADYVLMVDSDVVPPRDALVNLMEHDVEVCLGYYAHQGRLDGTTCLCKPFRPNYDRQFDASELIGLRDAGKYLVRVKGGGLGCALIDMSVFDRIAFPWFEFVTYADGHGVLSEDLYFCEACGRAGIEIYGDARVSCGHVLRYRKFFE